MSIPLYTGIVKQIVSGDTVVIRDRPKNSCPKEKTIVLMGITAPKLSRKKRDSEEKDEPFAWEAREYLRDKLIGQEVFFFFKPFPNDSGSSDRQLGKVFFPTKVDDVIEELVTNGLVKVKKERTSGKQTEENKLAELEENARLQGKGIWGNDKDKHIRPLTYPKEFSKLVSEFKKEPVKAIIEAVRTGPFMIMLDLTLLPSFYSIPFAISGVKFNDDSEYYKDEAKFYAESKLLQQSGVQVVIEKSLNNYVVGSVIHPKGNIAEAMLKEGFVCCDERTIYTVHCGAAKLRAAEKSGKESRLRMWQNAIVSTEPKADKREFQAVVTEIINGEALWVKNCTTGDPEKIFLSSIRSPKEPPKKGNSGEIIPKNKTRGPKSIFDVPWLFEAREFLRKKLIGKKVTVIVDYVQPPRDTLPEKTCCTVMVGATNIAEALVADGLAIVMKHRERDDRSSHYDELNTAEMKAIENQKGLHSKGDPPKHRVNDLQGKGAAGHFPLLQKADHITAIVEYVASGSRMRCYIPKDSLMITFLLSGISCPRPTFRRQNESQPAAPFGDDALNFTKERVLQREVEIRIESIDKKGAMVGTLIVHNVNLALALIEAGLADLYSSCSDKVLIQAEKIAKENKIGIWSIEQEDQEPETEEEGPVRAVNYIESRLSVISPELHLLVHHDSESKALAEMVQTLQLEFASTSPVTYSKDNPPPKGRLCAAKFSEDFLWYRGKIEKLQGGSTCKALIYFVDYGNRQYVSYDDLAPLPESAQSAKPFAHEYALACVNMPPENYYDDVAMELVNELGNRPLNLNVEYVDQNVPHVTLVDPKTNEDLNKICIEKGLFYVKRKKEKKLQQLVREYDEAQANAKKERKLIWEYGDARADDAKEFGLTK